VHPETIQSAVASEAKPVLLLLPVLGRALQLKRTETAAEADKYSVASIQSRGARPPVLGRAVNPGTMQTAAEAEPACFKHTVNGCHTACEY